MSTYHVTISASLDDRTEIVTVSDVVAADEWKARTSAMGTALQRGDFDDLTGFTATYDVVTMPVHYATEHGTERGKSAAAWVFDGSTDADTYRRFLALSDDGDPALYDEFGPSSGWLSGEFADTVNFDDIPLMCNLSADDDGNYDEHDTDECATAYETAADVAYWDELERIARLHTEG